MSGVPVTRVEASSVEPVEPVHPACEVRGRQPDEQVEVVGHQAVGQTAPPAATDRLREKRHEHAPVRVVDEDRLAPYTACRDVHGAADRLDARRPPHLGENVDGVCRQV
jgi:hypothetical protein